MKRVSVKSISVDQNVRCKRIIPVEGSRKETSDLQTVAITVTKDEAIHLARVLLAASQEWEIIDITAFRFQKRKEDGTYPVTVNGMVDDDSIDE